MSIEAKNLDSLEFDPDQGGRIIRKYITEEMANRYFAMFWGRTDVYAKRGKKGGYFLNVIIAGMIDFVLNSKGRKYIVKIVRTQAGLNLLLKK